MSEVDDMLQQLVRARSHERRALIYRLHQHGVPQIVIAEALRIAPSSVSRALQRYKESLTSEGENHEVRRVQEISQRDSV